jgi:vancomycin permeability regulator SanA
MTILGQTYHRPAGRTGYRAGVRRTESLGWRAAGQAAASGVPRLALYAGARGIALFFGLFALLNLGGQLRTPGFDENIWWLDLRPLPASLSATLLGIAGLLLVGWALRPAASAWRRCLTAAVLAALTVVAAKNSVTFYHVWREGLIRPWLGVPFSLLLAVVLATLAAAVASVAPDAAPGPARDRRRTALRSVPAVVAALLACGVAFPLAQQAFFGKTTYVRPVRTAVVFGAQVHGDGHASISLVDRVRTAAELYRAGLAQRLLMSGGRGPDEPFNETSVMRSLAISFGVPASRVSVDAAGVNTDATVRDTVPVLRAAGGTTAVVSDFFHLPRIKLAYERAGYDVLTVPSHARRIPQTTGLVVREIPAFWVYYLRAVL